MNKYCSVGVIGAGVMGCDVAMCFAAAGYNVVLMDISESALLKAEESLASKFRKYRLISTAFKSTNLDNIKKKIAYTKDYESLSGVQYLIENVTEDWETKKQVYETLAGMCLTDTIIGVNTSCISVTKLAALMPVPENMIGTHFMNPVPSKDIVEVVTGYHTSDSTKQSIKQLLKSVGKKSIFVDDLPGFVANRLSHLFMNEAAYLVQDKVANPASIDSIFKRGYGHAMGPLETADLIGLDTVANSLRVLYESYQDSKFRCCPLLQKMVDAGDHGVKTGQGFYQY